MYSFLHVKVYYKDKLMILGVIDNETTTVDSFIFIETKFYGMLKTLFFVDT